MTVAVHACFTFGTPGSNLGPGAEYLDQQFCGHPEVLQYSANKILSFQLIIHNFPWTIEVLGFDFRRELVIFFFTTASRTALEPTQPPVQWVTVVLSLGVKRPEREADHSPPSRAEVKNEWSYTATPLIRLSGVVLRSTSTTISGHNFHFQNQQ
jgi:hypothetical protein